MTPASDVAAPGAPTKMSRSVLVALVLIPINFGVWFFALTLSRRASDGLLVLFSALALTQLVAGIVAFVQGVRFVRRSKVDPRYGTAGVVRLVLGLVASVGAVAGWLGGMLVMALGSMGGAWGRPLRVRGRQLHPELREGADWTRGERPSPEGLDEPTRRALEALWLHDAQKEHASVPAFARLSWLLATVGAPAELAAWCHRAALEEIEHTRLCFALAAGYGGRSHTVEPMPDLLLGGLDGVNDPRVTLAAESIADGCLLEDYNADVAAECARACEESATRAVLEQIAREERSHADFSWALVTWLLERHPAAVRPAVDAELSRLEAVRRPTAVSSEKAALVAQADAAALRRHGRLPDAEWARLWALRLDETRRRVRALLGEPASRAA